MSQMCYFVLGMHQDKRRTYPHLVAGTSDVFESIVDGNNALAIELSAVENRFRGGQGEICPDGSRDMIIGYESTVGQRSVRLWSATVVTSLHEYHWKLREKEFKAPSRQARLADRAYRPSGRFSGLRGNGASADRFVQVLANGNGPSAQVKGVHPPISTLLNGFQPQDRTQMVDSNHQNPTQVNSFYHPAPSQIDGFNQPEGSHVNSFYFPNGLNYRDPAQVDGFHHQALPQVDGSDAQDAVDDCTQSSSATT